MPALIDAIPPRLQEILDGRVFGFAQAAQRHFKTNDLVVVLDFRAETPGLEALPRQALADSSDLPAETRLRLAEPASALSKVLGSPDQSFWFLVIHEDEDSDFGAVNAAMLAPGGSA